MQDLKYRQRISANRNLPFVQMTMKKLIIKSAFLWINFSPIFFPFQQKEIKLPKNSVFFSYLSSKMNFKSPAICSYFAPQYMTSKSAKYVKKVPQGIGAHTCAATSPTLQCWGMRRAPYVKCGNLRKFLLLRFYVKLNLAFV